MDAVIAILGILALMIGLPVLILWLRDRGGFVGSAVRRIFGLTALLLGFAMIGAVVLGMFDRHYLSIFGLIPALLVLDTGWEWLTGPGIHDVPIALSPEELEASVAKARAALPRFLDQVGMDIEETSIELKVNAPDGTVEHVWGQVHSHRDGCITVSWEKDHYDEDEESFESREVPLDQVEDWEVMCPDGRIRGAYSRIALFEHYEAQGNILSPKMRKQKAQLIDAGQGEDA